MKHFDARTTLLVPPILFFTLATFPACGEDEPVADDPASGGGASSVCDGEPLPLLADASDGGAGGTSTQPEHVMTEDESGFVKCENGRINRQRAVSCGEPLTFDLAGLICDDLSVSNYDPDFEYAYYPEVCAQLTDLTCEDPPCLVQVGCRSDADCAEEGVCVCATEVQRASHCVPASCKSNEDCESGECGAIRTDCESQIVGFACRTSEDECHSDEECDGYCGYDDNRGLWACLGPSNCE